MKRPNPEFLTLHGEPEDGERINNLRDQAREVLGSVESDPEMKKQAASIDWSWVMSQYQAVAEKSGIDPDSINFLDQSHVYYTGEDKDIYAAYLREGNAIVINPVRVRQAEERWGLSARFILLFAQTHEQGHAISRNECRGYFELDIPKGSKFESRSGFNFAESEKPEMEDRYTKEFFVFLDEAVTEKLSRKIVADYIASHPDFGTAEERQKFEDRMKDDSFYKGYDAAVTLVEAMIRQTAAHTGVSEEMVWQAMVREKIAGEMSRGQLGELLKEVFSSSFVDALEKTTSRSSKFKVADLARKMDLPKTDPELWQKIERQLQAASVESVKKLYADSAA